MDLSVLFNKEQTIKTFKTICLLAFYHKKNPRRNKKDKRGIVIRNKARLVAQGHTQEEWSGYDEDFAPIARTKAIRLLLVYDSFKDFVVYQMDVKSAFLYGNIEEEVYVCQPPGFEDPDFPDRVYKVEKKFRFTEVKNASTTMKTQKPLLKDEDGEELDVHMYRYQVNPKVSRLYAMKGIFRPRLQQGVTPWRSPAL
uniref:Copia protein n=1 Tax=Tanacetum cinerariifolium TaxID=118510 RepID=A0A699IDG7_TANCI|nr:copia protein [Tanacetum cinerariifolium]